VQSFRRKDKQSSNVFSGFWPNPGPGRLPLDSDRGGVESARVVASVASLAVSFGPVFIFWNLAKKKLKIRSCKQDRASHNFKLRIYCGI